MATTQTVVPPPRVSEPPAGTPARGTRKPPRWATQERPLPPLHEAAWSGGVAAVRALLESGANAGEANHTGDTALHWASAAGDVASVGVLAAAGTCVTTVSDRGRGTLGSRESGFLALHWAADGGSVSTIGALLAAGTPVDATTDSQVTTLHCATEAGEVGAIRALLDAGADVEAVTDFGETPLHCAAYSTVEVRRLCNLCCLLAPM